MDRRRTIRVYQKKREGKRKKQQEQEQEQDDENPPQFVAVGEFLFSLS